MASNDVSAIVGALGKKGTFLTAAAQLEAALVDGYTAATSAQRTALFDATKRAASLLRSRYTAPGFWRAGLTVFQAAEKACGAAEEHQRREEAARWMQLAEEELARIDDEDGGEKAPARETAPAVPASVPARPVPEELGALLSALMGSEGLEQLQHVLDSSAGESGPPPAARDARFNLDVKAVKVDGTLCAVCQEEFAVNGKAKVMPCGHFFHYDCLMEWLERHNSCPTCRFQLPSERPALDAEAARVAAAAPSATQLYS